MHTYVLNGNLRISANNKCVSALIFKCPVPSLTGFTVIIIYVLYKLTMMCYGVVYNVAVVDCVRCWLVRMDQSSTCHQCPPVLRYVRTCMLTSLSICTAHTHSCGRVCPINACTHTVCITCTYMYTCANLKYVCGDYTCVLIELLIHFIVSLYAYLSDRVRLTGVFMALLRLQCSASQNQ